MSVMALYGTFTGSLPGRFGGDAYRTKDPKIYWTGLAIYYLGALGFIGSYLHDKYGLFR